jgi:hypothetical protein
MVLGHVGGRGVSQLMTGLMLCYVTLLLFNSCMYVM